MSKFYRFVVIFSLTVFVSDVGAESGLGWKGLNLLVNSAALLMVMAVLGLFFVFKNIPRWLCVFLMPIYLLFLLNGLIDALRLLAYLDIAAFLFLAIAFATAAVFWRLFQQADPTPSD